MATPSVTPMNVVHASDGSLHNFPSDATPEEMDNALKSYEYNHQAQVATEAYRTKAAQSQPGGLQPRQETPTPSWLQHVLDIVRPMSSIPAVAAGTEAASAIPGPPALKALGGAAVGAGTYLGLDTLLQRLQDQPPQNLQESLTNSAGQLALNELGTRAVGGIVKGGKALGRGISEAFSPGSVIPVDLAQYEPTTSQLSKMSSGKALPGTKFAEDVLAQKSKAVALDRTGTIAKKIGDEGIRALSDQSSTDPNTLGALVRASAKQGLDQSFKESEAQASAAKLIAKGNVFQIQSPSAIPGVPLIKSVEGPIHVDSAKQAAAAFLSSQKQELLQGIVPSESEKQLTGLATKIMSQDGPFSFEEAWNLKRTADEFSYLGRPLAGVTSVTDTQNPFRSIGQALNDDIDKSIPQWENRPTEALKAWQNAKATVAQRVNTFNVKGDKLSSIIDRSQTPLPAIDRILADPQQLQRTLSTGELKFPSGAVGATNMKKDLGGYKLAQILQGATSTDLANPGVFRLNPTKVAEQWNDPKFQISKDLLYNKTQQADIGEFLQNMANVQDRQIGGMPTGQKIWMAKAGLVLAPSLLTGAVTGSPVAGGLAGAGVVGIRLLGGAAGKLLTNPKTARIIVAASAGQPLGVSDQYASRVIASVLQGGSIALLRPDGSETQVEVRDGSLVPVSSQQR